MPSLTLSTKDAIALLGSERWWDLAALRSLLGGQPATILGYDTGPDSRSPAYAFLAADVSAAYAPAIKTVRRFILLLRDIGLLSLDLASGPLSWRLEGTAAPKLVHRSVVPKGAGDRIFFNLLTYPTATVEPLDSMDLLGAQAGHVVVFFHTEVGMANSSVFFDVAGKGKLRILLAGLAPGFWEIWRDGFLEDSLGKVQPDRGTLFYEGEAGSYFLRQR
jgi:hypothetical protein